MAKLFNGQLDCFMRNCNRKWNHNDDMIVMRVLHRRTVPLSQETAFTVLLIDHLGSGMVRAEFESHFPKVIYDKKLQIKWRYQCLELCVCLLCLGEAFPYYYIIFVVLPLPEICMVSADRITQKRVFCWDSASSIRKYVFGRKHFGSTRLTHWQFHKESHTNSSIVPCIFNIFIWYVWIVLIYLCCKHDFVFEFISGSALPSLFTLIINYICL